MSKLTNEQIVERSREELAKASKGLNVGYDSDRGCVVIYYREEAEIREPLCDEFVGEGESYINFIQHAHENLAACHAEIDRLTKMVNAMRCCDNCKHGCVQRDVDEDCSLGKWWDGCGREETYEFWEWNGVE